MNIKMSARFIAAAVSAIIGHDAAFAHHSAAAFDRTKPVTLDGTVQQFLWDNPHTWVIVAVPDGKGGTQLWKCEGPPTNMLTRNGWTYRSFRPGDKIHLLLAPYRDGSYGGEFLVARDGSGKQLKF